MGVLCLARFYILLKFKGIYLKNYLEFNSSYVATQRNLNTYKAEKILE